MKTSRMWATVAVVAVLANACGGGSVTADGPRVEFKMTEAQMANDVSSSVEISESSRSVDATEEPSMADQVFTAESIESRLQGLDLLVYSPTDAQLDCGRTNLVATAVADFEANFIDLCLGEREGIAWVILSSWSTPTINAWSAEQGDCVVAEVRQTIGDQVVGVPDRVVESAAACGFYGSLKLPADTYSADTLACVDAAAVSTSPTHETERATLRSLVAGCGSESELEQFDETFVSIFELGESLQAEFDALSDEEAEELERAFEAVVGQPSDEPMTETYIGTTIGFMSGLGNILTDEEDACARSNLVGRPQVDFAAELVAACLGEERGFLFMVQGVVSFLGQVELTPEDDACLADSFRQLDMPMAELLLDPDFEAELMRLPVRCGTIVRFYATFANLAPPTVDCLDENLEAIVESLEDEAGIRELVQLCATPAEQEALLGL